MYKIQDIETGLFLTNNKYISWTKRGKTYATLGNLRIRITAMLKNIVDEEIDRLRNDAIGPYSGKDSYWKAWREFHNRGDIQDLASLLTKYHRKELYQRFFPNNWRIVKIAEIIEPVNITIESLFS